MPLEVIYVTRHGVSFFTAFPLPWMTLEGGVCSAMALGSFTSLSKATP